MSHQSLDLSFTLLTVTLSDSGIGWPWGACLYVGNSLYLSKGQLRPHKHKLLKARHDWPVSLCQIHLMTGWKSKQCPNPFQNLAKSDKFICKCQTAHIDCVPHESKHFCWLISFDSELVLTMKGREKGAWGDMANAEAGFWRILGIMVRNHKRASGGDVRDKTLNAHSYLSVHLRTCCCQSVRQTGLMGSLCLIHAHTHSPGSLCLNRPLPIPTAIRTDFIFLCLSQAKRTQGACE